MKNIVIKTHTHTHTLEEVTSRLDEADNLIRELEDRVA